MTNVRDIVDLPGMPVWVRFGLALMGAAVLRMGAALGEPMVRSGWAWGAGLATLAAVLIGADLLHSAARKRWPLVLFSDLIVARLVGGRRS